MSNISLRKTASFQQSPIQSPSKPTHRSKYSEPPHKLNFSPLLRDHHQSQNKPKVENIMQDGIVQSIHTMHTMQTMQAMQRQTTPLKSNKK